MLRCGWLWKGDRMNLDALSQWKSSNLHLEYRVRQLISENERLAAEIEKHQREPYIVLKHEGRLYKAYEVKEMGNEHKT
jgi:hypothetical protein